MSNDAYLPIPPEVFDWILGEASNNYLPSWEKNCPHCKRPLESRASAILCLMSHMLKVQVVRDWNGLAIVFHYPMCWCGEVIDTTREDWEEHLIVNCPAIELERRTRAVMKSLAGMDG